jgi:hypothetical protein
MRPGDLVKVVRPNVLPGIELGDLAILTEIDWDHRQHPNGILTKDGERIMGRGYFFFPDRPAVHTKFQRDGRPLGVMLLFSGFEVISGAS